MPYFRLTITVRMYLKFVFRLNFLSGNYLFENIVLFLLKINALYIRYKIYKAILHVKASKKTSYSITILPIYTKKSIFLKDVHLSLTAMVFIMRQESLSIIIFQKIKKCKILQRILKR